MSRTLTIGAKAGHPVEVVIELLSHGRCHSARIVRSKDGDRSWSTPDKLSLPRRPECFYLENVPLTDEEAEQIVAAIAEEDEKLHRSPEDEQEQLVTERKALLAELQLRKEDAHSASAEEKAQRKSQYEAALGAVMAHIQMHGQLGVAERERFRLSDGTGE